MTGYATGVPYTRPSPRDPYEGESDLEQLQRLSGRPGPFQAMADAKLKEIINRYAPLWQHMQGIADDTSIPDPYQPQQSRDQQQEQFLEQWANKDLAYDRLPEEKPLRSWLFDKLGLQKTNGIMADEALDAVGWAPSVAALPVVASDFGDLASNTFSAARHGRTGEAALGAAFGGMQALPAMGGLRNLIRKFR